MGQAEMLNLIMTTIVLVITQVSIFMLLTEYRYDYRKTRIAAAVMVTVSLTICILGTIYRNTLRDTNFTLLTLTLPSLIFFFVISRYRGIKFIVTYCITDISIACVDLAAYMVSLWFFQGDFTVDMIIRCISMLLWSIIVIRLVGDRYRKALQLLEKGWGIMMVSSIAMYTLMSLLAAYPTPINERPEDIPISIFILGVIELMLLMIIRVIYSTLEGKERDQKEQELKTQLSMSEQQFHMISSSVEEIKKLRHDLKYHLNIMAGLLQNEDYENLREYIGQYLKEGEEVNDHAAVYSSNYITNILFGYYKKKCEELNITVTYEFAIPCRVLEDDRPLTAILGNMWQNAMEACMEQGPKEKRYIHTVIICKEQKLLIKCINSCDQEPLKIKENHILSTKKENRGMGLKSVRQLVEQENGYCSFEKENGEFTFAVVIPLHEQNNKQDTGEKTECIE